MNAFSLRERLPFLFLLVITIHAIPALAQVRVTGDIAGTVVDPSGALLANAQLTLKDVASNAAQSATSSNIGAFAFNNLRPGTYQLTAKVAGFQQMVLNNVIVDAAKTTNLTLTLQVGTEQTVEVNAAAPVLETTSSTVATTVRNETIQNLPLAGRDVLPFALLVPGASQPSNARFSTFNGLPGGAINITLDGINDNSQRFHSGDTSFFTFAPIRLGAVDEVTVSTSGNGADTAEGGMQIRFVTKRGTNSFHGSVFEQLRNDVFNANDWFSNARGLPRQRLRLNEFGGNLGGPLWKNRLFFFFNYEEYRQPATGLTTATLLTPSAQNGVFTYRGTDSQTHTANLLQIAAAHGLPSTIDPTIADQLSKINGFAGNGTLSSIDLFRNRLSWNQPGNTTQRYPTARVDFQITHNLLYYGTWNLWWRKILGTPDFPGASVATGSFKSTYYIASQALNWAITPRLLNQFNFGVQSNVELFNGENKLNAYDGQGGKVLTYPLSLTTVIPGFVFPQPRNNPVYNLYDNVTWSRGNHTIGFGGTWLHTSSYQYTFGLVGLPQYSFGVVSSDPANSAFNSSTMPALSNNDLPNALSLYAMLTARVSGITSNRNVDERTKQYGNGAPLVLRDADNNGGIYVQDSWRFRPNLTLNYGFRWEFSGAAHNTNGTYTSPDYANLLGPSSALFQPGTLNGVASPAILQRSYVYTSDFVNPAPSFGFAWNPTISKGILGDIFGGDRTVIRGNYGINYFHEGLNTFENVASNNPGDSQQLFANGGTDFTAGSVFLSSPLPTLNTFPSSFSFPLPESLFTFNNSFLSANPNLRTPYVQNWGLGIQRELGHNVALEVRYVGNHAVHLWRAFNLNEVNIFENGFLKEFQNAQNNLTINQANGQSGFANNGLPGQSPLPIFGAAFGALGSQPAVSASQGFNNQTFITLLQQGQAGALANALAGNGGNATYLCRMVGSALPACGTRGFSAAGAYPINFFQVNPFAAGRNATLLSDPNGSNYHGLQAQLRWRNYHGLTLTTNYTWSHAIADRYGDLNTDSFNFYSLRNTRLNRGPATFDARHVFQTFFNYDLPFGPGRHFATSNGALSRLVGGWALSPIVRLQTGRVFTLNSGRANVDQYDSGVVLNGLTLQQLQQLVKVAPNSLHTIYYFDPKLIGSDGRANPALIAAPTAPGQFAQYISLYGPRFWDVDAALSKETPITERVHLTFQAEVLNLFNHPDFLVGTSSFLPGNSGTSTGGVVTNILDTTFGQTTSLATGPRNIQLRMGISF
jgi:hypothetical protein